MTKGTVLVASPSAIGRQPEASGSRVPAWPARLAVNRRFTTLTAWVEVMPTGLSSTTQPWTSRLSRLNCLSRRPRAGGLGSGADCSSVGARTDSAPGLLADPAASSIGAMSVALANLFIAALILGEVALHLRRAQQLVDALGLGETFVGQKADVGREFEIDGVCNLAADEFLVALEGGDHFIRVTAGERHDVDRRQPQVGGHAHFRHGDEMALDHRVMHVAAREQLSHRMAHQFADAQLALRSASGRAVAFLFVAHNNTLCGHRPRKWTIQ